MVSIEINALKKLKHPNIVQYFSHSDSSIMAKEDGSFVNVQYIALEYWKQGEIFDFVAQTGRFSEEVARYYFHQLIEALEYMHGVGYAHRDIKPENILMDNWYNIKIADFGFATQK